MCSVCIIWAVKGRRRREVGGCGLWYQHFRCCSRQFSLVRVFWSISERIVGSEPWIEAPKGKGVKMQDSPAKDTLTSGREHRTFLAQRRHLSPCCQRHTGCIAYCLIKVGAWRCLHVPEVPELQRPSTPALRDSSVKPLEPLVGCESRCATVDPGVASDTGRSRRTLVLGSSGQVPEDETTDDS